MKLSIIQKPFEHQLEPWDHDQALQELIPFFGHPLSEEIFRVVHSNFSLM